MARFQDLQSKQGYPPGRAKSQDPSEILFRDRWPADPIGDLLRGVPMKAPLPQTPGYEDIPGRPITQGTYPQMASRSGPLEDYMTPPPAGARGQVRVPNDYMDPENTPGLNFQGGSLRSSPQSRQASVFGRPSFELPPRGNSAKGSEGTDAVTGQPMAPEAPPVPPSLNAPPPRVAAPPGPQLPPGWRFED